MPGKRVMVGGVPFDALTERRVVKHVRAALDRGEGGWILVATVDAMRRIRGDPDTRAAVRETSLAVADGAPMIWASRLAGTPLPGRVSGADLLWSLARTAAEDGRRALVLGGAATVDATADAVTDDESTRWIDSLVTGSNDSVPEQWGSTGRHVHGDGESVDGRVGGSAGTGRAVAVLREGCPGLNVVGAIGRPYGFGDDPGAMARLRTDLVAARPDLVLVGAGFAEPERLIAALRVDLPGAWFLDSGTVLAAGASGPAPAWIRRVTRHLRYDMPFTVRLLARAAVHRIRYRGPSGRARHVRRHGNR